MPTASPPANSRKPKRRTRSRRSTSSPAAAAPDSELDRFATFCEKALTLEDGQPLRVEPFQRQMLTDHFAGARETLILIGKKNGKSTLLGALALYHVCSVPDAECVIAAASRDQAAIMLRQAQGFIRRSEALQERLTVKQREVVHKRLDGRVRILASDVDTADGVIPTLALVDELHRHKTADLYGVFRDGLGPRDGQLITISTAGADQNSALWKMRQGAIDAGMQRAGAYMRAGTDAFVLHEWSLGPDEDLDDLELVKTANPLSLMTVAKLRERHDSPSMAPWQWARFACNVWTQGEKAWLPIGAWDECRADVEIPASAEVFLGVDLGLKHDSAAIVAVHPVGNERFVTRAEIIEPLRDGTSLDIAAVEARIRSWADDHDVRAIAYDPWRMERSAQMLEDEGLPMIEFPMTNARMAPASEQLYEAVMSKRIAHDGDPTFASHVNAGVPTETERGWRLTKRKAKDRIDSLIGLVMAYNMATLPAPPEPWVEVVG